MGIVPAVGLGLVVVFFAAATLVYLLLDTLAKMQPAAAAKLRARLLLDTLAKMQPTAAAKLRVPLTERNITRLALAGGGVVVAATVLLLVALPQWRTGIWIGLTVLGIVTGLLTFILRLGAEPAQKPEARKKSPGEKPPGRKPPGRKPTESAEAPPRHEGRPKAGTGAPPVYESPPRPAAAGGASAPKGDPYRDLMAKVKYDQRQADRLIEQERKRLPLASLDDLCRNIIARLEREGPDR